MIPIAILRNADWEPALFLHVLGAMLLVGSLVVVVAALLAAWRRADGGERVRLTRFAFRSLLVAVLPSYLLMRLSAEWLRSEAPFDDDATWMGIGYVTSDLGIVLFVATTLFAGLGLRRLRAPDAGTTLGGIAAVLATLLLAAYVVAVWAMTTKPD